ncbi:hypothetical protein TNCV_3066291 [Trichonephila clavipes]|uniref:Uncharacterized protein n=1 Tax=Trichonephila clavipes TaxID=2585209 RepID=A0A8X6V7G6_TRICX|nr:hypothetical protein TNCV_3066291 [Trichonephila clavipes]
MSLKEMALSIFIYRKFKKLYLFQDSQSLNFRKFTIIPTNIVNSELLVKFTLPAGTDILRAHESWSFRVEYAVYRLPRKRDSHDPVVAYPTSSGWARSTQPSIPSVGSTKLAWGLNTRGPLQTDQLIETSAPAPQHSMALYSEKRATGGSEEQILSGLLTLIASSS